MSVKRVLTVIGTSTILVACSSVGTNSTDIDSASVDMYAPLNIPSRTIFKANIPRHLKGRYIASDWSKLPGWSEDNGENIWLGLVNNCRGLMRPVSGSLSLPARATPQAWYDVCRSVASMGNKVDAPTAKQFLQQYLRPWAVVGEKGSQGLVTGYYEPVVHGSRSRGGVYQWPMYASPADLLTIDLGKLYPELAGKRVRGKLEGHKVVPYDTREELTNRRNQPPVIVWLDDPVEAFFLQVQGSGRVVLDNGSSLRLAYANHNGWPYSSIGKWLVHQGELSLAQASMQNIKQWAKTHPDRVAEMLNVNKAMVFFKEEAIQAEVGPKGAYGIPLIAKRTIAVDPSFIPLGTPVFLATSEPNTQLPLRRVVFAQDTGAAIKGAARADFFWGSGDKAGQLAGRMKQVGFMWILWPRSAGEPSAR